MKNKFRKFGYVLAVSALLLAGVSTLQADNDVQWRTSDAQHQRFVDIQSGGSGF